jgi:atlastin
MSAEHVVKFSNDGNKSLQKNVGIIDKMLLHPEVQNRNIVVVSVIGEYRKGKSFLLDYCLRFMYANVS